MFAGLACGVECIGQVRGRGREGTGGLVEGSLCLLGVSSIKKVESNVARKTG